MPKPIVLPPDDQTDQWEQWKNNWDRTSWVGGGDTSEFPHGPWAGGNPGDSDGDDSTGTGRKKRG